METYLQITQINDFIFCPRSIFFHNLFRDNFNSDTYRDVPQKTGLAAHAAIDSQRYSDRKNILQGVFVYSEKYDLLGRIDIFNTDTGELTERKYSITRVYDGFRYQLYAQLFAMTEMGYTVKSMKLHSSKDNKNYVIAMPTENDILEFESVLLQIRNHSLDTPFLPNPAKCAHCNYRELCDYSAGEYEYDVTS